jgi:hypothetical protein
MKFNYPSLMASSKTVSLSSGWTEDEEGRERLVAAIEIDSVTVEGLSLRLTARRSMADRKVMAQLEHRNGGITEPLSRIDWRPLRPHRNFGRGPKELRFQEIPGSHLHSFDLNWFAAEQRMLAENLPIAVPIDPEPAGFRQLLALLSTEFRIVNAADLPMPSWDLLL